MKDVHQTQIQTGIASRCFKIQKNIKNTKIEAFNFSLEQSNRLPQTPHNTYFLSFDLKISIAVENLASQFKEL